MEKEIKKALSELKDNDEFYDDKKHLLQKALELVKDSQEILNKVQKIPTLTYEIVNVEFTYIDNIYKAQARFYLKNQTIGNIKVARKEDSYFERFSLSRKLQDHLELIAENQFKKLFEI